MDLKKEIAQHESASTEKELEIQKDAYLELEKRMKNEAIAARLTQDGLLNQIYDLQNAMAQLETKFNR